MGTWRRVTAAIDEDMQHPQLLLPFPDEKTIDMARCCAILHVSPHVVRRLIVVRRGNGHVSPHVVRRLIVTPLEPGNELMSLVAYNTMRCAPLRIDYQS